MAGNAALERRMDRGTELVRYVGARGHGARQRGRRARGWRSLHRPSMVGPSVGPPGDGALRRLAAILAALAPQLLFGSDVGASPPALAAGGKLDLHLRQPIPSTEIEGVWLYQPMDASDPCRVTIRRSPDGFYDFEARREGWERPVLHLDRSREGSMYRGEIREGFDGCIPEGARFSLVAGVDALLLSASLPVTSPIAPVHPGACAGRAQYRIAAAGHGEEVRLRDLTELSGRTERVSVSAGSQAGRSWPADRGGQGDERPAAGVTLGGPTVLDGTAVEVLGSVRDANLRLWHKVRPLDPEGLENPSEADRPAGDGSGLSSGDVEREGGRASRRSRRGGAAAAAETRGTGAAGRNARSSGYVPAANVLVHWECRLERPISTGSRADPDPPEP